MAFKASMNSDCFYCGGRTWRKAIMVFYAQITGQWHRLYACDYCGAPLWKK